MIENLILIGIGFVLGMLTTVVVLYVGGKAVIGRKISKMNSSIDRAQRMLDEAPEPDPEKLLRMLREVEDLEE